MLRIIGKYRFVLVLVCLGVSFPAYAWYYFTDQNGKRMQWVFETSCNLNARPILVYYDADTPADYAAALAPVFADWNMPQGSDINLLSATPEAREMSSEQITTQFESPESGQIWVVWDADGSVLTGLGIDPGGGLLGLGVPITPYTARTQDICAGVVIMNGLAGMDTALFGSTVLHELGHALGFAHSLSGGAGGVVDVINPNTGTGANPENIPIMYPFYVEGSSTTLNPDDRAGVLTVYGN